MEIMIRQAQDGDRSAFEALLAAHYDVMFRIAFKWCGNRSDAEDITQTACIKLAHVIGSYRFEAAFTSWLYRLVINTAIDWRAQNRRHETLTETDIPAAANGEDAFHAREMLGAVMALPEKEKTALLLVFGDGMNHAEAAFAMDCKESTVSWYIHEARKKLAAIDQEKKDRRHG